VTPAHDGLEYEAGSVMANDHVQLLQVVVSACLARATVVCPVSSR
jgi:hypothetical protein